MPLYAQKVSFFFCAPAPVVIHKYKTRMCIHGEIDMALGLRDNASTSAVT
jgi:hypothetical protein